jgi:hypothetical protein
MQHRELPVYSFHVVAYIIGTLYQADKKLKENNTRPKLISWLKAEREQVCHLDAYVSAAAGAYLLLIHHEPVSTGY